MDYEKTSVSFNAAEDWLNKHKNKVKTLKFVPTLEPKVTGEIMSFSMKKAEEKEKERRAYRKAHITNDIDFELVFH